MANVAVDLNELYQMESLHNKSPSGNFASLEQKASTSHASVIKTPSLFCLMDLPTEIRLNILKNLLLLPEEVITIHCTKKGPHIKSGDQNKRPSVSIIKTCKRINEEGTQILYGRHVFQIYLRNLENAHRGTSRLTTRTLDAGAEPMDGCASFLRGMRWSTISCMGLLLFTSNTSTSPSYVGRGLPSAVFSCTGSDLLSHYNTNSTTHELEMLRLSNYISIQVFYAELDTCKKSWDSLTERSEEYLAALADDAAT